jgi:hypothetical protein
MTKSQKSGENEITLEARREAARTNRHVCNVLAGMLAAAKAAGDAERVRKIIKA